ncbi:ribonuclease HII [Haloquadratum walsbyi]|nr:ribonuclease HII [Haloquadratum walsbyi]
MHSRIGSDEAGKGPVLGPMVCAAVRAPPSVIPDDIDDSKRLDVSTRRQLQETLRSHTAVDIGTVVIPVTRIDDPRTNMNTITVNGHIEAIIDIGEVAESTDTIIADASDVSESRFARRIKTGLTEATDAAQYSQCTVEARHGADEDDPLVAAASVIAKVRRDEEITTLAKEYETYGPIGSGYPSDQTTREFLQRYTRATGELPDCARRSWATADQILETVEQSSLSDI